MGQKFEGLTEKEAGKRKERYGYNEIEDVGKKSALKILFEQVKSNFMVYLLLFAMAASFFVGKAVTAYVILVVILLVVFVGFFQEYRAEKSIEKLKEMVLPNSIVIREGIQKEIPTKEIVPGDILVLRTGERIPADCLVLYEKNLLVNEAILTGESEELKKVVVSDSKNYSKENELFAGSFIVNGKCTAKVLKTGMDTKFGKIARMISSSEKDLPLQKKVNKISKIMAIIGASLAFLTSIAMFFQTPFYEGLLVEVLILFIAISVSAFPEGFPVVLITTLSVGAAKMARKNAIVNRMSIIETLGETTIICSDKTGTITKGEMTAKKIFLDNELVNVSGVGYNRNGEFLLDSDKRDMSKDKVLNKFLKCAVLCNDAIIRREGEEESFKILGAPTEASLLVMASKANIYREDFNERIEEIPFSSERKMMSVLYNEGNKNVIYTKGALEYVLDKCHFIQRHNGVFRLLERDKKRIINENKKMTSESLRTLALAYAETKKSQIDEENLIFLGVVGMEDPPREGVKESLILCKRAGIKIKMITGDDKETALAIAKQIDLGYGKVVEGYEIDALSDKKLLKVVREAVIFSRVKPEHKLRIVKALKENGEIVTMTGDGVNDAPALKEAHIGVAMGKNGTDVSRSAADLTLKDDNFVTLVDAIKEGRTIFNNIRKFVSYQLSCNYSELLILFIGVLLAPIFGWPIPLLLALQILFMNIVTDNLPAITLGLNKSSEDIMQERPRKRTNILNKDLFIYLVVAGSLMTLFVLGTFYVTFNIFGQTASDARTTALLALIFLEIAGAFNFRSFRKVTFGRSLFVNPYLAIASFISVLATVLIVYTPLNSIFGTVALPFLDWAVALSFGVLFIIIFDILKKFNLKKDFLDLNH